MIVCWPGPTKVLRTVRNLPSESSRLSVPVTVRLCWTAQATAAGHQIHCCRCTPQSQGPSLRQREVGAAGARGRSNPLAGENCLHWHEASGQACCQSARAIRTSDRADNLLAGARGHTACRNPHGARDPHADKQTIAFNGARYGGLHKFRQFSFGYGQTILLYAQTRKREQ